MRPAYLGDGVYAAYDGHHVILTTSNGLRDTNTIYLEPDVLAQLDQYVKALRESKGGTIEVSFQEHAECPF